MKFRCCGCGSEFPAREWNNATRRKVDEGEFKPIQTDYKDEDRSWYCPNCSEDEPDVRVVCER